MHNSHLHFGHRHVFVRTEYRVLLVERDAPEVAAGKGAFLLHVEAISREATALQVLQLQPSRTFSAVVRAVARPMRDSAINVLVGVTQQRGLDKAPHAHANPVLFAALGLPLHAIALAGANGRQSRS